ncbi:type II secretion system protein GspE [bacterium Unc6]|nr:type II secretion system protein GspE [bacterium Unc6]
MTVPAQELCDVLRKLGLLTKKQSEKVLLGHSEKDSPIEEVLVELGFLSRKEVLKVISAHFGAQTISLLDLKIPADVISIITPQVAHRYRIIPVQFENNTLTVATFDPDNLVMIDELRMLLKCNVEVVRSTEDDMKTCLGVYYPMVSETVDTMIQGLTEQELALIKEEEKTVSVEEEEAPVIKLVSLLIHEAFRTRASDIHIEPLSNRLRIRFRIDGVLQEIPAPPRRLQASVLQRIKLMAGMDIAERRLPQDGRIMIVFAGRQLDLRVSDIPGIHGESIVMRILDKTGMMKSLPELGFMEEDLEKFVKIIESPNGILLVTGPTGSGKTTTLYAALSSINKPNRKLITVEDPVEYQITGINQVHVKPQIGLTFASGLRAMLRQAPDVIMVGEMRDYETAGVGIQAALTGHLVFSTLHTNDAPSAITRLIDMGIKPYLVASAVQAVLAQRLIRTICEKCKEPYEPTDQELAAAGWKRSDLEGRIIYKDRGCNECSQTGFRGRKGIYELLIMNDKIRELIFERSPSNVIKMKAREAGMKTLREDGFRKVLVGITTLPEVLRITQQDIA